MIKIIPSYRRFIIVLIVFEVISTIVFLIAAVCVVVDIAVGVAIVVVVCGDVDCGGSGDVVCVNGIVAAGVIVVVSVVL